MKQNELFEYLVKPLNDLEASNAKSFQLIDERFLDLENKFRDFCVAKCKLDEQVHKLEVAPNKLENRVSRLEGQAQKIDPLKEEVASLSSDFVDQDNEMAAVRLDMKVMADADKSLRADFTKAKANLSDIDKFVIKARFESEEFKKSICELREASQQSKSAFIDLEKRLLKSIEVKTVNAEKKAEEAKHGIADFGRRADQFEKALERKLEQKIERSAENQDMKISSNATEISGLLKKLSELIHAVDLMEGRIYRIEKVVETCEKRCDNFGSQIREIKAEIGG